MRQPLVMQPRAGLRPRRAGRPCPARARRRARGPSTCSRLVRSRITLSTPMPASSWPSSRPDGPEPMMTTCVRVMSRASRSGRRARSASRSAAAVAVTICGSSSHSSVQAAPDRSCSCTSAWCIPESCVALKRASADQRFGRHRIALVRHRRRAAAAAERDLAAVLRHQRDVLPELAEAAADQRQPAGEVGDAVALAVPLRRVGEAKPRRPALLRTAVRVVAELVERAGRAAELHDQQTRRLLGQPLAVPFERPPPRGDAVARRGSGSPAACASSPSAPLPPKRASMRGEALDELGAAGGRSARRSASAAAQARCRRHPGWSRRNGHVAPCGSPTAARSCRTSSGTTTPSRATPALSLSRSGENESSAAAIACAAAWPMMPSAASASASARSKSSIAASSRLQRKMARRFRVAEERRQQGVIEGRNGHLCCRSAVEEDRFLLPLEMDVERVAVRLRAARSGSARECGARCATARDPLHWPFLRRQNTSACAARY